MANTYSQIYIQVVFAVQGRQNLIQKQNNEELHKFMTGIVREREQKLLAVHCMPDHTHILIGLKPAVALSDVVRDLKNGSTNFINRQRWVLGRFCWQEGFGGFTVSRSLVPRVEEYIKRQKEHHLRQTYEQEVVELHRLHDMEFVAADVLD